VPVDRLLVETDSPFLAPQAFRGRDNAPQLVQHTLAEIARVRGQEHADLVRITADNARAAFPGLR
jgi:TatD DNase family protein